MCTHAFALDSEVAFRRDKATVFLFTNTFCSACDEVRNIMVRAQETNYHLVEIDVDEDPYLTEEFGHSRDKNSTSVVDVPALTWAVDDVFYNYAGQMSETHIRCWVRNMMYSMFSAWYFPIEFADMRTWTKWQVAYLHIDSPEEFNMTIPHMSLPYFLNAPGYMYTYAGLTNFSFFYWMNMHGNISVTHEWDTNFPYRFTGVIPYDMLNDDIVLQTMPFYRREIIIKSDMPLESWAHELGYTFPRTAVIHIFNNQSSQENISSPVTIRNRSVVFEYPTLNDTCIPWIRRVINGLAEPTYRASKSVGPLGGFQEVTGNTFMGVLEKRQNTTLILYNESTREICTSALERFTDGLSMHLEYNDHEALPASANAGHVVIYNNSRAVRIMRC